MKQWNRLKRLTGKEDPKTLSRERIFTYLILVRQMLVHKGYRNGITDGIALFDVFQQEANGVAKIAKGEKPPIHKWNGSRSGV